METTELSIGISKSKYGILLPCALGFVALGIYIMIAGGAAWIGLTLITIFGVCVGVFMRQLVDHNPKLSLSSQGFIDHRLDVGLIEWSEICTAKLDRMVGHAFITVELKPGRLPTEKLYISLTGLAVSVATVEQFIESRI